MADTKIEWTATFHADGTVTKGATWNPTRGCSRKSPGCRNCYAEHMAMRITHFDRGRGKPEGTGAYDGLVTMTSQGPKWTGEVKLVYDKLDEPLRWKRPRKIFVDSMSDLFHEKVPDDYIAEVFAVMAYARQHTFIVLTKCAQRMRQLLSSEAFAELFEQACDAVSQEAEEILAARGEFSVHARLTTDIRAFEPKLPLSNAWLGVSVEDQQRADERIPELLSTPAAKRLLSMEPLLGSVELHGLWSKQIDRHGLGQKLPAGMYAKLHWVIGGGESGREANPMHPAWPRSIRDQCKAAGVPFFFKQWGEWAPVDQMPVDQDKSYRDGSIARLRPDGSIAPIDGAEFPVIVRAGKGGSGRLLDGVEHNQYPEA